MYEADFTYPRAYEVALEALTAPDRPAALICATDRIAYGVYKAARELGLRIPEDVAVTGFGGYDTSEVVTPPLTTVRFDVEVAACVCAETVLRLFRGGHVAPPPTSPKIIAPKASVSGAFIAQIDAFGAIISGGPA